MNRGRGGNRRRAGRGGRQARLLPGLVLLLLSALTLQGCAAAASPPAPPATGGQAASAAPVWRPSPADSWQWQLSGAIDVTVQADIFDVDFETTTTEEIDALKQQGRRLVCYFSAGSWEDYRGDAGQFPLAVRGEPMDGWPDEQWLDIRQQDVLLPIVAARMDACAAKGFDAVEPDNLDGYVNETGFPLTAQDQLAYNRAVARLAHDRGLSVALKNDVDQIPELVEDFDFAINEECVRYDECGLYAPFTGAGKAVLHVEYQGGLGFCPDARRQGFSSMLKPLDLGAARSPC
ncbi:endo alpha-1,4 polygalactosaminidase [Arthrobacter yangruifuii]|uniref:Endo alpha-1,4 polygalactosaminidase n=1 Tax=Arthrobacter yangruifuii TaxID=2606616 RepID=A0A5N6MGP9_9MICC|nr:endo alpha-1,4 polygalactosaminidase [Arthrobacter yangruifuii]KAD3515439.1 endo alpha-1,4 polygalactosaminidase [Arthrobacter yangruifuii]